MELAGVGAGYGRHTVVSDVTLTVPRRSVTALIGPNGSGKTTLLRVLLGLLKPRAGTVRLAAGRPPRIGYVPQTDVSEVRFPVTARDVVLMGLAHGRPPWSRTTLADDEAVSATLAQLAAEHLLRRPFRDLSGGQRQRVLLARGLVADPELLVLDEPVRGLDFASAAALVERIASVAHEQGAAVVVATHSLDLVANHADHVALVKDGHVDAGPAAEIMTTERLTAFHGRPVAVADTGGWRVVVPGPAVPGPGADARVDAATARRSGHP